MTRTITSEGTGIGALRVRILWGDYPLHDRVVMPPAGVSLGIGPEALSLPRPDWLGAAPVELVRVVAGRVFVRSELTREGSPAFLELARGERLTLAFGAFSIEVGAEDAVRAPVRRFHVRPTMFGYFTAAAAVGCVALGALSAFGVTRNEETLALERLMLMRHYLRASAEREMEPDQRETEGGTGTRAKGEEGKSGGRYAVQGPLNTGEPTIVRQVASEAQSFGMIGLLSQSPTGAASGWAGGNPWGDAWGAEGVDTTTDGAGDPESNTEEFADHGVNPPVDPQRDALSTFAIDVDTGAYTLCKRILNEGELPPLHAVRAEEFLNAFDYGYEGPEQLGGSAAFAVHLDAVSSPYETGHHFVRVGIQGRRIPKGERRPVHLVYLVDTSGSMDSEDKIGLAKKSLGYLTEALRPGDTVALATYAGSVREVLAPTGAEHRRRILEAIENLTAEGSTAMESGIDLAYELASRTRVPGHESRVIVLSDGDANVGKTSASELLTLIETRKKQGITLSTVGFGRGNYKDATMERFADAGDGNYSYIGSEADARRVFSEQVEGLIQVIARDVKLQVAFDPAAVAQYRLIGYENRDVADPDFRNDDVDGGEVGSGHSVTALYDLVLKDTALSPVSVTLRYKPPSGGEAVEQVFALDPERIESQFSRARPDVRFAVAVAGFAELLRGSPHALLWKFEEVERSARGAADGRNERAELVELVRKARSLRGV